MERRLEKYYLFCETALLNLFTMKFVRYMYTRQNTFLKLEKKPTKYIVNFRYISEVSDMVHLNHI